MANGNRSANLKDKSVLIVGAGAFGLSTALHLLQRGWEGRGITIIDRSPTLPAPDAASTDINKVVRSSHSDPIYTCLARDAIVAWKNKEDWGDAYHESGVMMQGGKNGYTDLALKNDLEHGSNVKRLQFDSEVCSHLPHGLKLGTSLLSGFDGYINFDGGWANARQSVERAMEKVQRLGARIEPNKPVCGLTSDGLGVRIADGTEMRADLIIIASGSWTPSIFPGLGISERVIATGQSLGMIQLSEEEAKIYADIPVILNFTSGFCLLPPNASNVMKLAMHTAGYTRMKKHAESGVMVSTPRTHMSHQGGEAIPLDMLKALREGLNSVFPDLGQKPFASTRLCWYADTPNSDWLIDFHPNHPSILFATGGSGHAFKFFPILGRLVADRLEKTLDPVLTEKFAFGDRVFEMAPPADLTRVVPGPSELDLARLCSSTDLNSASVGDFI